MTKSLMIKFFFFVTSSFLVAAQQEKLHYEHLLPGQTVNQNTVMAILQDRQGFMWFGTNEGLHRFDGYQLKTFRHEYGNPNSLSSDFIVRLMEDSKGNIWIATVHGGVNVYNPRLNSFCAYQHDAENPNTLSNNNVRSIYEDKEGMIWIGTIGGGLNKFDPKTESFTNYKHDKNDTNSIKQNYVTDIIEDSDGFLWIGLNGYGIDKFDKKKEKFTNYQIQLDNPTKTFRSNVIRDLYDDGNGNIWAATYYGLNKLNKTTGNFTHWAGDLSEKRGLKTPSLHGIVKSEKDYLWIITFGGGIHKFNLQKEEFVFVTDLHKTAKNLYTAYRDRTGIIWLGTDGNGVCRYYDIPKFNFVTIPGLQKYVSKIFVDNEGKKWLGTIGQGIYMINNDHQIQQINVNHGLSQNFVESITQDTIGNIWIGTNGAGLNCFDPTTYTFSVYRYQHGNPKSLYHDSVFTTYADPWGSLWFGTSAGLSFFDKTTNKSFGRMESGSVHDILRIDKQLWLATGNGLLQYDIVANTLALSPVSAEISNKGILHRNVNCIFNNDKGETYLGTNGGVNLYDPKKERFVDVHKIYQMPYVEVTAITQDHHRNLWLLTNKGLLHLDRISKTAKFFDQSDGMKFSSKAIYFDSSTSQILIGGIGGYYAFHPDAIIKNNYSPPVILTDVKLFNKSVSVEQTDRFSLGQTINFTEEIALSYKENMISFEFAALNYKAPEKNQYTFKLEGFDKDWIVTDASYRFATYTNLDPGNYTFMVKGSNNDGVWSDVPTSLKLIITPPFWKTWWAYILYTLMGIVALIFARQQIIRRERLRNKLQQEHLALQKMQEVNTLKSQFFANISHEFRTPLTLIIGPLEKMLRQRSNGKKKELTIMHQNAKRLLRLINQLLDLSRLETGKLTIKKEEKELIRFIRTITSSFDSLADQKKIQFKKQVPAKSCTALFDPDKLEKILYNLLSNAFKFTPEQGSVTIAITFNVSDPDHELLIFISDTGKGIENENLDTIFDRFYRTKESVKDEIEGTGIGLALTKELIDLMKGTIHVESEKGKGTVFRISLPIEILEMKSSIATNAKKKRIEVFSEPLVEKEIPTDSNPVLLIVEDNEDLRYYIRECLGNHNYQFIEAANGKEGLEKAMETVPNIIISDLMMPKMNGMELCKLLKTHERTNHIPFIMLTAKASKDSKMEGLETGADDYITKPFESKELTLKIKNFLQQQIILREKFKKELLTEPYEKGHPFQKDCFIDKLRLVIEKNIDDPDLTVDLLSKELAMSRVQLYRKTLAVTGLSPSDFIRIVRLKKASCLLQRQDNNVSDVAYAVGFNNLSYFTKCFRGMFGKTPSEYRNN